LLGAPAGAVAEPRSGPALISENDPWKFMIALADAVAGTGEVFLCDPRWGENERAQLTALQHTSGFRSQVSGLSLGWLCIPTGGTSGRLKFARHDEETLSAAVRGFARHFGVAQVNALGVLPLHHVSGLMAWMRCALTGGEYRPLDWKALENGERPALPAKPGGWTISLVPTQLERLLGDESTVAWLKGFRIVLLGGGPAWPALLDRSAAASLPLSLGYGMTETAAMVTALRPEEFLAGARSSGAALPHATVRVGADDTIMIGGDSLFRGYHPDWRDRRDFETQDRGRLDERKHLQVLGRRDAVIITGGEKVEPAELEAVLRDTGQFPDLVVLGLPDAQWGQQVVVVYPGHAHPDFHAVIRETNKLADYKRPKRYIPLIGPWPAGAPGKVNRTGLAERVAAQLKERR
jgi:O-succinylbenzoic acid--CoA ligase